MWSSRRGIGKRYAAIISLNFFSLGTSASSSSMKLRHKCGASVITQQFNTGCHLHTLERFQHTRVFKEPMGH